MGLISFALKGNYGRYYNDLKELSKKNGKPAWWMFLDTALCTLVLGSGLQDYLNYEFHSKKFKERRTYVSVGYLDKVTPIIANIKWSPYMSNKLNFHKNYGKYTKRDFFDPEGGFEAFEAFLDRNPEFVFKPQIGQCGEGVTKMVTAEITDRKALYERALETKACVEELIKQHPDWEALGHGSVHTIRVLTGAVKGKSRIMYAAARVGSGVSIADNFHLGGSAVLVDVERGCLVGNAIDKKLNEHEVSATGIRFDGYPIPYWEEVKRMVLEAALVNDEIHLVGWDVAIGKDGPLVVEGNRSSSFDIIQVPPKKGARDMLDGLIAEIRAAEKEK